MFKKIKFYFRILKAVKAIVGQDESHYLLLDSKRKKRDLDLADLARGRWLRYKLITAPEHSIRLDKDAEAILEQKVIYEITQFKRKLTGKEELKVTARMIELCKKAEETSKNILDYIKQ
jgi:hypothetical protein